MPSLRLLNHMVRITKFKLLFKGNTRTKPRIVEGVMFINAFIKGTSGFLRPMFCTTTASGSFAPASKGSRIRPPAYLDWTFSQISEKHRPVNLQVKFTTSLPQLLIRFLAECCHPHSRVGRRELEFMIWWGWNCPWRYFRATVQHEISNLWQRGRQAAGGSAIWYRNSKTHQKTLVRTIKLPSTALAFTETLKQVQVIFTSHLHFFHHVSVL